MNLVGRGGHLHPQEQLQCCELEPELLMLKKKQELLNQREAKWLLKLANYEKHGKVTYTAS